MMPAISVRIDRDLYTRLKEQKPHFLSDAAYLNLVISQALDKSIKLDGATEPASGEQIPGRSPSNNSLKAVNKTANKEHARVSSKTTRNKIPEELQQFVDGIKLFWDHRSGKNTDLAWNGLLRELGKIQTHVDGGNDAVAEQLQKGAEAGWKSITLSNYLKNGLSRSQTLTQASADMEAHYERMNNIVTPW